MLGLLTPHLKLPSWQFSASSVELHLWVIGMHFSCSLHWISDFLTNINSHFTVTLLEKQELSLLLRLQMQGLSQWPQTCSCRRQIDFPVGNTLCSCSEEMNLSWAGGSSSTDMGCSRSYWGPSLKKCIQLIQVTAEKGYSLVLAGECTGLVQ